jgi:hypothetical protein
MGLVEALHAELARGPTAAALAARERVAAEPDAAAAIADDANLDINVRVAVLLALALVAQDGVRVPDAALSALEDDVLLDAVLASGAASAVTGLLCAAGARVSSGLRRYLALRIRAAGAAGVHVGCLLVEVGEVDAAIDAALPTLRDALCNKRDDDHTVLALALLVAEWSHSDAGIIERLREALPREARAALDRALRDVS